jgi:hypothetical protein
MRVLMLFVMLVASVAFQAKPNDPYTYNGIAWGSDRATVDKKLADVGLIFDKEDRSVSEHVVQVLYKGQIAGEEAAAVASFDQGGKVHKIGVTFLTADEDCIPKFESVKAILVNKYGRPDVDIEHYDSPYEKGDGHQRTAIKLGLCTIAALWENDAKTSIGLTVNKDLTVSVAYEGPGWSDLVDKARAKGKDAF